MKVLLVSANTLVAPYPVYPLGLDYVAAAISPPHEVRIADLNTLDGPESLKALIHTFDPHLVGVSLRNIDNTDCSAPEGFIGAYRGVIDEIREATQAPVVLGGSGFTIFPDALMSALGADFGIVGEGERLRLLLDALETGADPAGIPGVALPGRPATVPPPWQAPFRPALDLDSPHLGFYLRRGGMLNLQTKRGCGFRCIYCTYPHIEGCRLRLVPPEEVAASARRLQAAGARYFFVTDSAFNADYAHSAAVAEAFIRAGVSIPWGAFFAPTRPPEGYFRLMADAGLTHVEFGTESLSDPILKAYGKPFRSSQVAEAHQAANAAGLHVAHYLLLGGPGETARTLKETLEQADRFKKTVFFFFCGMRIYPFTRLYDMVHDSDDSISSRSLLDPVFYRTSAIREADILREVRAHAQGRINWVVGSGGEKTAETVSKLYDRGFSGPLWEFLIQ